LANSGARDEAIIEYERTVNVHPSFLPPYFELANQYLASNRDEEAIDTYNRILGVQPSNARALLRQCQAYRNMLELVNYIEHYGIVRKLQEDGRYERVNPLHSWNASHKLSNYFLFQLQRHSDHHYNAIKRYQVLHHYNESPQLPFGYPTMILIALVPPLWFSMMNPLLNEWKEKMYSPLFKAA
jgi:tetratricopeptide (TPR) repeat protein